MKTTNVLKTLLLIAGFSFAQAKPAHPFPFYQNYPQSLTLTCKTQSTIQKEIEHFYDDWKKNYLIPTDKGNYRIATDKHNPSRTISEAQGYGMLLTAYFAGYDKEAQKIFNGLFRFAKAHPSTICHNFMTWQVPEKKGESDSAFDGDADIAYSLLLADKQWGSQGAINYQKEAKQIINALMEYTIGEESFLPLLGDWVDPKGETYNQFTTRSSDFMLAHFRTFYHVTQDSRWLKVIQSCQKALEEIQSLPTNQSQLISDFLYFDQKSKHFFPTKRHFLESEDNSYYYNACRIPFRIGVDALLNQDKRSQKILQKMIRFIAKSTNHSPSAIKSGYHLDGTLIGDYFSSVFVAPFGVAAKLDLSMQNFFNTIYLQTIHQRENYYEDSITLLSLLLMSNTYWDPR